MQIVIYKQDYEKSTAKIKGFPAARQVLQGLTIE